MVAIFVTKSGAGGAGERSSTTENHGPLWALLKSEVRVFCVSWPQLTHSATHVYVLCKGYFPIFGRINTQKLQKHPDLCLSCRPQRPQRAMVLCWWGPGALLSSPSATLGHKNGHQTTPTHISTTKLAV